MNTRTLGQILAIGLFTVLAGSCATPDFDRPKRHSTALGDVADTELGQMAAAWSGAHNGLSGFYPLEKGLDALGLRLELARRAEKSIDLQYFLMKPDTAGFVVANALLEAADRGVRVRFLLDDVFTTSPDRHLVALNEHPDIEVRIFNPVSRRGVDVFNFLGDFDRANRRMHNKSFTVDNSMSIVGGRNIASEYFQLENESVFLDIDVLAIGPISKEVSSSFDEYWNHARALPVEYVADGGSSESIEEVRADLHDQLKVAHDTVYAKALESQLLQDLISGRLEPYPAEARVISDSPDKLVSEMGEAHMKLANDLLRVVMATEREIIFITPYYVPGEEGVEVVRTLVERGVRVVIVTNSLASNNHIPVHSAYAGYRRDVIRAGAELYEVRVDAVEEAGESSDRLNSVTMHTKAFLIDGRYLFVGSLNLDPRSLVINSEMGLLIDSTDMVRQWTDRTDDILAALAYRVVLDEDGKLEWRATINGEPVVETSEPQSSRWRRFQAWLMKLAPESQL
jgi:putative cardiolipin synthase